MLEMLIIKNSNLMGKYLNCMPAVDEKKRDGGRIAVMLDLNENFAKLAS